MPIYVPRNSVDIRVVESWKRLMGEEAYDRGDDISSVQPFHPFDQTYPEVIDAVNNGGNEGLEHYRRMVTMNPGFSFQDKSASKALDHLISVLGEKFDFRTRDSNPLNTRSDEFARANRRELSTTVEFVLENIISFPERIRIHTWEGLSYHEVDVSRESDVDYRIIDWLTKAHRRARRVYGVDELYLSLM